MSLFDRLHSFIHGRAALESDASGSASDLELQAATAILLLEAAYGDSEYVWSEHRAILHALKDGFGLGKRETLDLLGRADEIRPPIVKLSDVTDLIAERFDHEQRARIVGMLWRVIEADHAIDEWEEVFAEHVARAVGLSSEDAARARRGD